MSKLVIADCAKVVPEFEARGTPPALMLYVLLRFNALWPPEASRLVGSNIQSVLPPKDWRLCTFWLPCTPEWAELDVRCWVVAAEVPNEGGGWCCDKLPVRKPFPAAAAAADCVLWAANAAGLLSAPAEPRYAASFAVKLLFVEEPN